MKPRSRKKTTSIHFTIPISLYTKLEDEIAGNESRSVWITKAIRERMNQLEASSIADANSRTLMAALTSREDIDSTLRHLLLQILAQ